MLYDKELAKRFISDYNFPIPLINEMYFFYHLVLYEKDYGTLTKYRELVSLIESKYNGECKKFLDEYYNIRENIIQTVSNCEAFQRFNKMNMLYYSIKNKPNITKKNIFNQSNVGKFFISVDMKKANFQALKSVDKEIVLGADTYEDFIGKFTDLDYIKESKYTRQVIFGKLNPSRHITVEMYLITKLYKELSSIKYLNGKCVSLSNDEIIFEIEPFDEDYMFNAAREHIVSIAKDLGLDVRVEMFYLKAYNLVFKESRSVRSTFFIKDYVATEGKFKLIAAPQPYHSIMYKLYKGIDLIEYDYHFNYEGMNAMICEEFDIEEVRKD